jgi:hypothetical protein
MCSLKFKEMKHPTILAFLIQSINNAKITNHCQNCSIHFHDIAHNFMTYQAQIINILILLFLSNKN